MPVRLGATDLKQRVHVMRIASVIAGTVLLSAASSFAMAQTSPPAAAEFATQASVGNTFEVQESQLALKQASSAKVKAFARMMISDHTKAEKALQAAAKSAGASAEMKLDDPHQAMVDALKAKTGADFDKAYIADQLQAHTDTSALLTSYEKDGDNAKLKAWAHKSLPVVNAHLKKVQAMGAT